MIKVLAKSAATKLFRFAKGLLAPPTSPPLTSKVEIPGLVATPQGLSGQIGTWQVEIVQRQDPRWDGRSFRITVQPVLTGLAISWRTDVALAVGSIPLYDEIFDSGVSIEGDVSEALILLRPEVRSLAKQLVTELNGSMQGQTLKAQVYGESKLEETLQDLLELAGHLERQRSAGLVEKLRQVVSASNFPDFRREAFDALRAEFEASRRMAPAPVRVPDSPLVRLRLDVAALLLYLGEEARALATELILKTLQSTWLDSDTRHAALRLLIEESDRETAVPVLEVWLSRPIEDPDLRRAAIRACARRSVVAPLLELEIESEADGVALLEAFAEIGDPVAQGRAIRELGHPSQRVRTAAAMALGRLGDPEAIPALVDSLSQSPGRRLRRAVKEATASIQERAGVFQSGELSIVPVAPLEGSLSRADGPTGAEVSLVDPPETE